MTDPLIEFLNARYDEAEAIAKAATPGPWSWEHTGDKDSSWAIGLVQDEDGGDLSGEIERGTGVVIDGVCEAINGNPADAAHIALHDPAAKLRDIAGKRKIVAMAEGQVGYHLPDGVHDGRDPGERECDDVLRLTLFEVLRNLAEEFSTHPEYNAKDWAQWPTP